MQNAGLRVPAFFIFRDNHFVSEGEAKQPVSAGPGVLVGVLVGLAAVTLQMCDASREAELANALAGAGLGGRGGASALGSYVLYLAIAAVVAVAIARAFLVPGRAIGLVLIGSVIATYLIYASTAEIARRRSHAVDSWSVCETPGTSPQGYSVYVSKYGRTSDSHDGPHLDSGDPCVAESEQRDVHAAEHPNGNVVDGLSQIMYRFPRDRERVIYIPAALLLGLVVAIAITVGYERRRRASTPRSSS